MFSGLANATKMKKQKLTCRFRIEGETMSEDDSMIEKLEESQYFSPEHSMILDNSHAYETEFPELTKESPNEEVTPEESTAQEEEKATPAPAPEQKSELEASSLEPKKLAELRSESPSTRQRNQPITTTATAKLTRSSSKSSSSKSSPAPPPVVSKQSASQTSTPIEINFVLIFIAFLVGYVFAKVV
eukprot:TRINITY_DN536_c0_g1_i1.p1 TRINITY_DN536_c0_g1~~TRINITY_DN536_c0_g1_i1.p1  ORF type:complete len:187 (+),score=47.19 TRINITY_DN536_c0_g1_i1:699-1259(+)